MSIKSNSLMYDFKVTFDDLLACIGPPSLSSPSFKTTFQTPAKITSCLEKFKSVEKTSSKNFESFLVGA